MKWLVGALLAIGVAWLAIAPPTYTLRWKLTVQIDTPQGTRSASSVLETSFFRTFGAVGGASSQLRGQAIFLDLGEGKNVIALMASGTSDEWGDAFAALPVTTLSDAGWGWGAYEELKRRNGKLTGRVQLPLDKAPVLLSFGDVADVTTAHVVDHTKTSFEKMFGPGYAFRQAVVEIVSEGFWPLNKLGITGASITEGIESKFHWWGKPMPWERVGQTLRIDTRPPGQFRWSAQQIKRD